MSHTQGKDLRHVVSKKKPQYCYDTQITNETLRGYIKTPKILKLFID